MSKVGARRAGRQELVSAIVGAFVLVAVLLAVAAHGARPPSPPALLLGRWAHPALAVAAVLSVSCAVVEILRWAVFIPRTLRARVAYAILPPPEFDPRPEAIEAFGQQLLGVRRRVLAWLDRPASAVRIQLTTTPDGRLLYVVQIPARFRGSLLNAYATAYPAVDLRPLEELA